MKIQLIANIENVSLGFLFPSGKEVTIGREIGNSIAPLVDSLSRRHARIYAEGGDWFFEDCGSTNGSYKDGAKVEAPVKLEKGARLRLGTMNVDVDFVPEGDELKTATGASTLTPAQAAAAAAAAGIGGPNDPTIARMPTIPGVPVNPVEAAKTVVPDAMKKPEPAPAPAPAPVPEVADIPDIPDLPPVEEEKPAEAKASPLGAGIKLPPKPAPLGAGLKLPPKPALGAGLKLPPKPGLGAGIKLPPKPGLAGGLKLPPKPGIKLPPKP